MTAPLASPFQWIRLYRQLRIKMIARVEPLLGTEEASGVAQEAFVRAWLNQGGFDPTQGNVEQWIWGIWHHVLADRQRDRGRRAEVEASFAARMAGTATSPATERCCGSVTLTATPTARSRRT
jgi:DNA-directed RNA polymerase specialized sigma24 family protein